MSSDMVSLPKTGGTFRWAGASMGHVFSDMVSQFCRRCFSINASMGLSDMVSVRREEDDRRCEIKEPCLFRHGKDGLVWVPKSWEGFNGAMSFQTW